MIRSLRAADAELVDPVARAAFDDLAARQRREPHPSPPAARAYRDAVHRHLLETGAGWGAFDGQELVGVALGHQRPDLWTLTLLVVRPGHQRRGTGGALLRAALDGAGPVRQVHSSRDPAAVRAYARAGFRLVPALSADGTVALETGPAVVDADPEDDDTAFQVAQGGRLLRLADGRGGTCLVGPPIPAHGVQVLAAVDRRAATDLLRGALGTLDGAEVELSFLAPQEDWAHDVALDAGLALGTSGPLCLSGLADPLGGVTKPPAVFA